MKYYIMVGIGALIIGILIGLTIYSPPVVECPVCETCHACEPEPCPQCPITTCRDIEDGVLKIDDCEPGEIWGSFKQSDPYLLKTNVYNLTERLWEKKDKNLNTTVTGCSDTFGCLTLKWYGIQYNTSYNRSYEWL